MQKVARRPRVAAKGIVRPLTEVVKHCTLPTPFDQICIEEPLLYLTEFLPKVGIFPVNWTVDYRHDPGRWRYPVYETVTAIHGADYFPYGRDHVNLRTVAMRAHRVKKYIRRVEDVIAVWDEAIRELDAASNRTEAWKVLRPTIDDTFFRMQNLVPMRWCGTPRENFNVFSEGELSLPY
jgi:hypothetical protein